MNVTADNITFGQNLTINVELPEDTKGNIIIIVDDVTYSRAIENGSVNLTISNLNSLVSILLLSNILVMKNI